MTDAEELELLELERERAQAVPLETSVKPPSFAQSALEAVAAPILPFAAMAGVQAAQEPMKRLINPLPGMFGHGAILEAGGSAVEKAVLAAQPRAESALMATPLAQAHPEIVAGAAAIPAVMAESQAGMLKPSEQAKALGTDVLMAGAGAVAKKAVKLGGRFMGASEASVERAIENPKILNSKEYNNPSKLDEIASSIKNQLKTAREAVSKAYDAFFKGTVDKRVEPLASSAPLKSAGEALGLDMTETGFKAARGTKTLISQKEIDTLNDVARKFAEDAADSGGKLDAKTLHRQRQYIDNLIDWKSQSSHFNSQLKRVRSGIDELIRKEYPEVKGIDARFIKVQKAADTVKRRVGIKQAEEIGADNLNKLERMISSVESKTGKLPAEEMAKRLEAIGGTNFLNDIKDMFASKQLALGGFPSSVADVVKVLLKTGERSAIATVGGPVMKAVGRSAPLLPGVLRRNAAEKE